MINLEINKLHYVDDNTQVLQIQPNSTTRSPWCRTAKSPSGAISS